MQNNRFIFEGRGSAKEEEFKEMLIETLKNATILSVDHQVDEIAINSFDKVSDTLRGGETLTISYVPDSNSFVLPATTKKTEKEDRKTIEEMLVKKKPK